MRDTLFFISILISLTSCTQVSNDSTQRLVQQRIDSVFPKKIKECERFLLRNTKYRNDIAFFVDMRIPSGSFRFFVVDLKKDSIIDRGLVAHGANSEVSNLDTLLFSNIPDSYQSSLGFYKVGADYQGSFGRSFKLHGLENSNSNAYDRLVVLHRYSCVPETEQTSKICTSLGCPMLSEGFFPRIEKYIDAINKPILMYIYY